MIIECSQCKAAVDAKVLYKKSIAANEDFNPSEYYFLECLVCKSIMLAWCEIEQISESDYDFVNPVRLYPEPPFYMSGSIPNLVRHSLEEANKCMQVKAYDAVAVMCGRTIEAICKLKVNSKNLAEGLKKLKSAQIIDNRIYEWGEALRKERNFGAHATEVITTKEDAIDIFEFAKAICEYIYVLNERYNDYNERKKRKAILK